LGLPPAVKEDLDVGEQEVAVVESAHTRGPEPTRIAVFGLGYVGAVSAASLADQGHLVTGVDINPMKVNLLQRGRSPILEPGLDELIAANVEEGRLRASEDAAAAVAGCDVSFICVGTPSLRNGGVDLSAVERSAEAIGEALPGASRRHTVVVRSTTPPGTCRATVIPALEASSGLRAGVDFGVAVNPEFLREGTSLADFRRPAKTVIGELDSAAGDMLERIYAHLPGALFRVPVEVAELVKYVENAFHALKIAFANEVGAASRQFGIDSHVLMEILCSDTKLNISTAYLRPGLSFGGSCLPKDMRGLLHTLRRSDLRLPLLESILPSNEEHLRRLLDLVIGLDRRRVGVVGLAFKPGTDDLRESPLVELSQQLLGRGFELKIYDPVVSLSRIVGTNREYIDRRIPHLASLIVDTPEQLFAHAEVCIIGSHAIGELERLAQGAHVTIVDLVRLPGVDALRDDARYIGIAW
jgi:GDP-mannose 6-dehydrogenase